MPFLSIRPPPPLLTLCRQGNRTGLSLLTHESLIVHVPRKIILIRALEIRRIKCFQDVFAINVQDSQSF